MDGAFRVAAKVELVHPARFLFNAGSTPKAWNEKMLKDEHFKVLHYEEDGHKRGLEQGREQGFEQGFDDAISTVAKNMLKDNLSLDLISKYTNLLLEEIEKLKNSYNYLILKLVQNF